MTMSHQKSLPFCNTLQFLNVSFVSFSFFFVLFVLSVQFCVMQKKREKKKTRKRNRNRNRKDIEERRKH